MNVGYDSVGTECGVIWSGVCGGKRVVTGRTEQVNLVLIVNILRTNTRSSRTMFCTKERRRRRGVISYTKIQFQFNMAQYKRIH